MKCIMLHLRRVTETFGHSSTGQLHLLSTWGFSCKQTSLSPPDYPASPSVGSENGKQSRNRSEYCTVSRLYYQYHEKLTHLRTRSYSYEFFASSNIPRLTVLNSNSLQLPCAADWRLNAAMSAECCFVELLHVNRSPRRQSLLRELLPTPTEEIP